MNMSYCTSCGKELNSGVKFCNHCGAAQEGNIALENIKSKKSGAPLSLILGVVVLILLALLAVLGVKLLKKEPANTQNVNIANNTETSSVLGVQKGNDFIAPKEEKQEVPAGPPLEWVYEAAIATFELRNSDCLQGSLESYIEEYGVNYQASDGLEITEVAIEKKDDYGRYVVKIVFNNAEHALDLEVWKARVLNITENSFSVDKQTGFAVVPVGKGGLGASRLRQVEDLGWNTPIDPRDYETYEKIDGEWVLVDNP